MAGVIPKTRYLGELNFPGGAVEIAVLETRTGPVRLFTRKGLDREIFEGVAGQWHREAVMARLLVACFDAIEEENLQPYITLQFRNHLVPYRFRGPDGRVREGYDFNILRSLMQVYMLAAKDNKLTDKQCRLIAQGEWWMLQWAAAEVGMPLPALN